ncbi:MAG TPA: AAA family ATPase [Ktedonobacteraceae bacterium]|nr:AAA family ATPase [Ktedonobacteraceae bacterium]
MEKARNGSPLVITVPRRTILVLCGPAASGKSTFASQHFAPSMIVSSDYCRELICDDSNNQHVNRDAFDLFYYIINKRMYLSRLTIADSTALQVGARARLLEMARRHGYFASLLIFNTSIATCLERNRQRGRTVEEQVIAYHAGLLQQVIRDAATEGWQQIHILDERNNPAKVEIITD